jgi:hypothetical protein
MTDFDHGRAFWEMCPVTEIRTASSVRDGQNDESFDDAREMFVLSRRSHQRGCAAMLRLHSQWLRARVGILSSKVLDFKKRAHLRSELSAAYSHRFERATRIGSLQENVLKVTCAAKQHTLYLAPQKRDDAYEVAVLSSVFCDRAFLRLRRMQR